MAAGQSNQVKTTLTQAQSLTNQIKTDLFDGKSKIDQAASMDISSEYRSYLNAKGKSIENSIALNTTDQEMISLWLSDPLMNKPDTVEKFTEMQNKETQQGDAVVAAEAEADAIAKANPDKIQ